MKRRLSAFAAALLLAGLLPAQEAIHSSEDLRYDFLALVGEAERPYLNYKTLSDSDWDGAETWKIYGPELFTSYNSTAPYGMNDGALWQGKGHNTSLTGGARYAAHGFELTLKPQLTFSQNQDFDLMPSAYPSEYGYIWGYNYGKGADAPQRFGDDPLYGYSWGDSEIRYTWRKATIGFGTQSPWIGPGRINSLLHSNNAPPYPKLDVGLRRTSVNVFGRYIGDAEARLWTGYLSESDYFDDDSSNDHNLISGFALAYAPSFLPGLTLFANRVYLAQWKKESLKTIPSLLFFQFNSNGGDDSWDQRTGFGFSYLLPKAGVEVYGELGINDNPGSTLDAYIKNFSHTVAYTGGLRKSVDVASDRGIRGELVFEWTTLEMTPVYSQFLWSNSFYMHHLIVQGYTNGGQWLGAGIGTGGNSQYLGFNLYYPKGSSSFFIHRYNPDNDFVVRFTTPSAGYPTDNIYGSIFKTVLAFGASTSYSFVKNVVTDFGLTYIQIHDNDYQGGWSDSDIEHGVHLALTTKILLN